MKNLKKVLSIIICVAMVTAMFACGVSAAETATEETTEGSSEVTETTAEDTAVTELPDEPEIIHIADGDELPDYFYVVPKEQIQAKGEFSLEGLYAYIAIAVKHDYLDPRNVNFDNYTFYFNDVDLVTMKVYYYGTIMVLDQYSYSLMDTYALYNANDFKNAEIVESIMRAIFTYCEAVGYDRDYLESSKPIYEIFELTPEKITFSEEQLHYFDD